jgi:hypothetical protein
MALNYNAILNDVTEIDGARALVAIDYSGGNQLVSTAVAAVAAVSGTAGRSIAHSRGLYITTAGNLAIITTGRTDAITVAFAVGWHPISIVQINQAASTAAGFYYF